MLYVLFLFAVSFYEAMYQRESSHLDSILEESFATKDPGIYGLLSSRIGNSPIVLAAQTDRMGLAFIPFPY